MRWKLNEKSAGKWRRNLDPSSLQNHDFPESLSSLENCSSVFHFQWFKILINHDKIVWFQWWFDLLGWDEFVKLAESLEKSGEPINVLFSGGKDAETGISWCPYCVRAQPVVEEALSLAPEDSHFIYCDVGERTYWRDKECPFRTDPRTKLVFLPTLLRWKGAQRLDGEQACKKGNSLLISMTHFTYYFSWIFRFGWNALWRLK